MGKLVERELRFTVKIEIPGETHPLSTETLAKYKCIKDILHYFEPDIVSMINPDERADKLENYDLLIYLTQAELNLFYGKLRDIKSFSIEPNNDYIGVSNITISITKEDDYKQYKVYKVDTISSCYTGYSLVAAKDANDAMEIINTFKERDKNNSLNSFGYYGIIDEDDVINEIYSIEKGIVYFGIQYIG